MCFGCSVVFLCVCVCAYVGGVFLHTWKVFIAYQFVIMYIKQDFSHLQKS